MLDLLAEMGDVMHSAGKGIMVNVHSSRIDMFRDVDGKINTMPSTSYIYAHFVYIYETYHNIRNISIRLMSLI